jgi:protein involved in polysaccharide export with SLBB domain
VGPITVAGLSFQQARDEISKLVAEQYIGVKAAVSQGELRSVRVFVLGVQLEGDNFGGQNAQRVDQVKGLLDDVQSNRPVGRMVIDLQAVLNNSDYQSIRLQDGDTLTDRTHHSPGRQRIWRSAIPNQPPAHSRADGG